MLHTRIDIIHGVSFADCIEIPRNFSAEPVLFANSNVGTVNAVMIKINIIIRR